MPYRVSGTYFENCSCEVACPCGASNLLLPATYDRCEVMLAFHVEEGDVDGLDVGGNTVVLLADTPKQMTDGGWRVGMLIDERASDEQREALAAVFGGQLGGPAALFAPLIGEVLGVEHAAIEYRDEGRRHSVRVGDTIDVEIEDFAGAEEGSVMTLSGIGHPASSTLTLARATRSRITAFGFDLSLEGRNGHAAPFAWAA